MCYQIIVLYKKKKRKKKKRTLLFLFEQEKWDQALSRVGTIISVFTKDSSPFLLLSYSTKLLSLDSIYPQLQITNPRFHLPTDFQCRFCITPPEKWIYQHQLPLLLPHLLHHHHHLQPLRGYPALFAAVSIGPPAPRWPEARPAVRLVVRLIWRISSVVLCSSTVLNLFRSGQENSV